MTGIIGRRRCAGGRTLAAAMLASTALAGAPGMLATTPATGQECLFTSDADIGGGSFRDCVTAANNGDFDEVGSGISSATIDLESRVDVTGSMTIGSGANAFTVRNDDAFEDFALTLSGGNALTITDLVTILATGDAGGGIEVQGDGNALDMAGAIETQGGSASNGIEVVGDGNRIDVSGTIVATEDNSDGIRVRGSNNEVHLSGSITTTDVDGTGKSIEFDGNGNNEAHISGTILNHGYRGALRADSSDDNLFVIEAGGTVTATGNGPGEGNYAYAFESDEGDRNTVIVHGILRTTGNDARTIQFIDGSNAGTVIVSGLIEATGTDSLAILFEGDDNRLELRPGFAINGDVDALGSDDTLAFGGAGAGSFNLNGIGEDTAQQYRGFDNFEVVGGVWTFTGATAATFSVDGGTLGGTGSFGGINVNAGGTVAPGASIGTLTVGTITFSAGSIYEVEISGDGRSDLIAATFADLGGTVAVVPLGTAGTFVDGQVYRILTAPTIDGAFAGATTRSAFIVPTLIHGGTFVDLSIALIGDPGGPGGLFPRVAVTPNQTAAARALDGLSGRPGDASLVFNTILGLSAEEARDAFDLASGEAHASAAHLIGSTFDLFTRTVRGQGASSLGIGVVESTVMADYSVGLVVPERPAHGTPQPAAHSVWLAPFGGAGVVAGDGNAAELEWWAGGMALGADTRLGAGTGEVLLGAAVGYLASGGVVEDRLSELSGSGVHAAVYGAYRDGPVSASAALSYGATHLATSRDIVFGAIDRTAAADYWVHGVGVSTELAYAFTLAEDATSRTTLSPLATLDAHWAGHDGAQESGADALDLTLAAADHSRLDLGLGLELGHTVQLQGGASVTLTARAAYEHRLTDGAPEQGMALAGSPVDFVVAGAEVPADRVRLGLGLDYRADEATSVNARYGGTVALDGDLDAATHSGSVGFNVRF